MKNLNLKGRFAGLSAGAKRKAAAVSVAALSAVVSGAAAAQTSGTTTTTIDSAPIVTSINSVGPIIIDIGGAVLAVVVLAWGYKTVKGFIGR